MPARYESETREPFIFLDPQRTRSRTEVYAAPGRTTRAGIAGPTLRPAHEANEHRLREALPASDARANRRTVDC